MDMKRKKTAADLEGQLREVIERSGLSVNHIAKEAGVSQAALCLFVNGKRGITLATASKIATVLGLHLAPKDQKKGK